MIAPWNQHVIFYLTVLKMIKTINELSKQLGALLKQNNMRCTTAESCTGGGLSAAITAIPGSSAWFECGFVTYSNQSKEDFLGVPHEILETEGAVSEACAIAMATGAIHHSHADLSVAITGIAGPDGGSTDKPVGTVWIAWANKNDVKTASHYVFQGSREEIRTTCIKAALSGLIEFAAIN